ncbi:uncharacterized protein EDB93DRAFT_857861 [Suillus bovinus]|uniref:uncharacterized protein n=1 Tax=Suillus bovinus TaxID=48563 RepID=UPI001B8741D7|nr:uncharacterized protein EDB93DRAFT_857861 [Suillus bovinus]KAG2133825.1 hypothetical protein EDB93DRAFT_857861 [Suillus bovinus]
MAHPRNKLPKPTHESQIMRFSSAIVLPTIAALMTSISAMPTTNDGKKCSKACYKDSQCKEPGCFWNQCSLFYCSVSRIFAFTSVEYGR